MRALSGLALAVLAAVASVSAQGGQTCNSTSLCPSAAPCCSEYGYCGTESFCLGGCNPLGSYKLESCRPNPVCKDAKYTWPNVKVLSNHTYFDGNASRYDFVVEKGEVINGTSGEMVMLLTQDNGGTKLSSTRYVHYGKITTRMQTGKWGGIVATSILMSNIKDEIDWEFPGDSTSQGQTNFFWQGVIPEKSLSSIVGNLSSTAANWHDYTIDWQPDTLTFLVDGTAVHTTTRESTLDSAGVAHYPSTPSRIQLSLWPAGINSSAPGTVQWAGGMIDWSNTDYTTAGHFWASVQSVEVTCADPVKPDANVTAYVYGANSSALTPSVSFSNQSTLVNAAGAVAAPRVLSAALVAALALAVGALL